MDEQISEIFIQPPVIYDVSLRGRSHPSTCYFGEDKRNGLEMTALARCGRSVTTVTIKPWPATTATSSSLRTCLFHIMTSMSSTRLSPLEAPRYNTSRLDIEIIDPDSSNPPRRSRVWPSTPSAAFSKIRMQRTRIPTHTSHVLSQRSRDDERAYSQPSERPPIPSALAANNPQGAYATPLPVLSIIVLSITMLGEFLSANVSTPFLLFMVEGFLVNSDAGADAGYWTGILVSMFFLSQFLTSLLWATVANRHGSRAVLFISLLGSAFTCTIFGTSQSLKEAIAIRLLQGIFAGSMGVARSVVANITDGSNEGRAYAILGFAWGLGGVAGAIVGGSFESPAKKWPDTFSHFPIFVKFPYLLPCMIASSVTLIGAILSLFLASDGGPRGGAIRLSHDKENFEPILEEDEESEEGARVDTTPSKGILQRLPRALWDKFRAPLKQQSTVQSSPSPSPDHVHLSAGSPIVRATGRSSVRTSRTTGTAYGYGMSRPRILSRTYSIGRSSIGSSLHRRRSTLDETDIQPSTSLSNDAPNFAQRLLMANEMAVTNIADLWVAAAMNVDNDEVFLSDDEESDIGGVDGILQTEQNETSQPSGPDVYPSPAIDPTNTPRLQAVPRHLSHTAPSLPAARSTEGRRRPSHLSQTGARRPQALSTTSSQIPSIYANSGLRAPPGILSEAPLVDGQGDEETLIPDIAQERQASVQPPSTFKQLPWMIILQYGLLALHSTTHDQVFLSYIVSKYEIGGLGLLAGNFAQLIAVMSFAQIVYQFYLYPNIGPPRGRFSHLSMFRVGSLLFIPAYLSVPIYRSFINSNGDGGFFTMTMLILSTSIRYCGSTFAYTAVAILLNYVSPPHIIGLANGLAQSIVSLARFAGPILGGYVWSISVQDNPGGYPLGFFFCGAICAAAILLSFLIR